MRYAVSQGFHVAIDDEALETHLDRVLDALADLGAQDADAGGSLASGDIEISMTVEAGSLRAAQGIAGDLARRAIALAGGVVVEPAEEGPPGAKGPAFSRRSMDVQLISA